MVYAALVGTALNAFGQHQANRQKKKLQRRGEQILQGQLREEAQFAANQRGQLNQGLEDIKQGFADAQIATANRGRAAQRRTLDRESELRSRAQQQLAGSGLLNSSVQTNLDQGIGAQTDRRLAEIDEGLAGLFSNLATQRAGALAGQRNQLANFFGQRQQRRAQLGDVRFDLLNTQTDFQPIDIGALVAAFGQGGGGSGLAGRRPPEGMNLNTFVR